MDAVKLYSQTNILTLLDFFEFIHGQRSRLKYSKGEVVLDIGCGPGDLTEKMFRTCFPPDVTLIGCDSSRTMIEYARKTYSDDKLTFRHINIEDPNMWADWQMEYCNKIISNFCLQWVKDHSLALRNMFSLLKKDGEIYIIFLTDHPFISVLESIAKLNTFSKYTKNYHHFKKQKIDLNNIETEYTKLLKEAGFKDVEVKHIRKTFYWPSYESALYAIGGVDPYKKHIPKDMKEEYEEALMKKLHQVETLSVDPQSGWITVKYFIATVYAKKY